MTAGGHPTRHIEAMNDDILLVDDDPVAIQSLARILSGIGTLRFATNGEDAIRLARARTPDLMLLDAEMPGMSGFKVCKALKSEAAMVDFPVIFITGHSEAAFEVAGFEIGAADFIAKPVNAALVRARVEAQLRVKHMADELRRVAAVDVMTGISNRRQFGDSLDRECLRARRSGEPLSLLMIDVDHFKAFNDRYGHPAGDRCLKAVAKALTSACLRPADIVARYGGEEFVVLLPQTPRRGAEHMARRVLDVVEALGIPHEYSPTSDCLTVSVGIACYDAESACWAVPSSDSRFAEDTLSRAFPIDLLQAADNAMYAAKHAGRGQAKLLDVADVDEVRLVRNVSSTPLATRSSWPDSRFTRPASLSALMPLISLIDEVRSGANRRLE